MVTADNKNWLAIKIGHDRACAFIVDGGSLDIQVVRSMKGETSIPAKVHYGTQGASVGELARASKRGMKNKKQIVVESIRSLVGKAQDSDEVALYKERYTEAELFNLEETVNVDEEDAYDSSMVDPRMRASFSAQKRRKVVKEEQLQFLTSPGARPKYETVTEVTSRIIRELKDLAETQIDATITNAVITIPPKSTLKEKEAWRDACAKAGFSNQIDVVLEPIASLVAHGLVPEKNKKYAVMHLGGTSFSVSIVGERSQPRNVKTKRQEKLLQKTSPQGKLEGEVLYHEQFPNLGGENFDGALASYLLKQIKRKNNLSKSEVAQLERGCLHHRKAVFVKHELTNFDSSKVEQLICSKHQFEKVIKRSNLNIIIQPVIDELFNKLEKAFKEAQVQGCIKEMVLTGGSFLSPTIRKAFCDNKLVKRVPVHSNLVAAYGAATKAALSCQIQAPTISQFFEQPKEVISTTQKLAKLSLEENVTAKKDTVQDESQERDDAFLTPQKSGKKSREKSQSKSSKKKMNEQAEETKGERQSSGKKSLRTLNQLIKRAQASFDAGDYAQALEEYEHAWEKGGKVAPILPSIVHCLLELAEQNVEQGKKEESAAYLITEGITKLRKAQEWLVHEKPNLGDLIPQKVEIMLKRAKKIEFLKQLEIRSVQDKQCAEDITAKLEKLHKLQIICKVPKAQRINTYEISEGINEMLKNEKCPNLKELYLPRELECPISRCLMTDPVTITSGVTYERIQIMQNFDLRKEHIEKVQKANDSDPDEPINNRSYVCPLSMQVVDPQVLIPNRRLKAWSTIFINDNPWAYEYEPSQSYKKILLWSSQDEE